MKQHKVIHGSSVEGGKSQSKLAFRNTSQNWNFAILWNAEKGKNEDNYNRCDWVFASVL